MRKKLLVGVMAALLALGVTACNDDDPADIDMEDLDPFDDNDMDDEDDEDTE